MNTRKTLLEIWRYVTYDTNVRRWVIPFHIATKMSFLCKRVMIPSLFYLDRQNCLCTHMVTWKRFAWIRDGGMKGLFTGIGPRVGRAGPSVGIVISFYEVVKYALHQRHLTQWSRRETLKWLLQFLGILFFLLQKLTVLILERVKVQLHKKTYIPAIAGCHGIRANNLGNNKICFWSLENTQQWFSL